MCVEVDDGAETTGGPLGGVPCDVAVLLTTPASTSAWTMVCAVVAVQVSFAPTAKEALGQVTAPAALVREIEEEATAALARYA